MGRITRLYRGRDAGGAGKTTQSSPDLDVLAENLKNRRNRAQRLASHVTKRRPGAHLAQVVKFLAASGAVASKAEARRVVRAFVEACAEAVAAGEPVQLRGFWSLSAANRPSRHWTNPATGRRMLLPAGRRIVFRPGKRLKAAAFKRP